MTKEKTNNLDHNESGNSSLKYDSTLSKNTTSPGFLVSFLVDARGGAMFGRRHSGVDIIIPPGKVCMPTRLTCRMVKRDKIPCLPPLSEEEAFVSRFIQVGPTHTSFIGPVLIEIPHFGSLQNRDREVVVMRSDDGSSWQRHISSEPSDAFLQFVKEATKDYPQSDKKLVTKVYTNVLPKYFVAISTVKQTTSIVDSKGLLLQVSTASINLPQGAVNKETRITLKVIPVEKELLATSPHDHHSHSQPLESSHIVSIEPRRRKFHQAVAVSVSVSKALQDKMKGQKKGSRPAVLLLYTLSTPNTPAVWEDATDLAPCSIYKDTVTFNTNVSARYWLLENHPISDTVHLARQVYQAVVAVPFYACFHVLAKPLKQQQWQVRVLCVDDMKVRQSMEAQDNFSHLASSEYVQVLNSVTYHISLSGNLRASVAQPGQLTLTYRPFRINRLAFVASVIDASKPLLCKVDVVRESGEPSTCSLDITLPSSATDSGVVGEEGAEEVVVADKWNQIHNDIQLQFGLGSSNNSNVEDLKLVEVAERLKGDWLGLADHLGVDEAEVVKLQTEYGSTNEQALVMLQMWLGGRQGAELPALKAGLTKIGREDIIDQCLAPPTHAANQDVPVHPIDSSYHESIHGDGRVVVEGGEGDGEKGEGEKEEAEKECEGEKEEAEKECEGEKEEGEKECEGKSEDKPELSNEEFNHACDIADEFTEEEREEEVVRVDENGQEVREVVLTKVRTFKKSPLHDAPELKVTEVPGLAADDA